MGGFVFITIITYNTLISVIYFTREPNTTPKLPLRRRI